MDSLCKTGEDQVVVDISTTTCVGGAGDDGKRTNNKLGIDVNAQNDDGDWEEIVEKPARHCSFCVTAIPKGEEMCCSRCHTRAYCSKKCQREDWKPLCKGGKGQGHKYWCGVAAGEEDLDWKLVPNTETGGYSMVALRSFDPLTRITVQRLQDTFECEGGHAHNVYDCFYKRCKVGTHDCDGNSSVYVTDESISLFPASIYFTARKVKKGETFTRSMSRFNHFNLCYLAACGYPSSPKENRLFLKYEFDIVCPPDCFCRRIAVGIQLAEVRRLYGLLKKEAFGYIGIRDPKRDLKITMKLKEVMEKVHAAPQEYIIILQALIRIEEQLNNYGEAKRYLKECLKIVESFMHPDSGLVMFLKDEIRAMRMIMKK